MIIEIIHDYAYNIHFAYQLVASVSTYFAIKFALFIKARRKRYKLFEYYGIPGPKPRLLDGSLYRYIAQTQNFEFDVENHKKYGDIYGVYIGDEPAMIILDLDILKSIFFEQMSSFKERSVAFLKTQLTDSILFTRHDRWKAMRKIMSPTFSTYSMRGNSSTSFLEESVEQMLKYIDNKLKLSNTEKSFDRADHRDSVILDIQNLMKATALHMISSMAIKLPDVQVKENEKYVEKLDEFLSQSDKGAIIYAIRFPFLRRILTFVANYFEYDKTIGLINRTLSKKIDDSLKLERDELLKQTQLIDILIKLHREGKLTRDEVIGNAEAILFAGYDTTSTTLAYVFWNLGKHTDIQDKLRNELMAHGIDSVYLDQVISETMRLYPTVISFTSRLATETVTIKNVTIPKGTKVIYNAWLIHRNPNYWSDPEKFVPERFLSGVDIHPCAYAPFGLGERKCLGYQLARLEMKMICCDLLLRYRISTCSPEILDLVTYAGIMSKPKEKILVRLEKL